VYGFSGLIPTNKQTNKGGGELEGGGALSAILFLSRHPTFNKAHAAGVKWASFFDATKLSF